MYSLINLIKSQCEKAIMASYPEINSDLVEVTATSSSKLGDYQCNSAMKISKILNKSPIEIANKIIQSLQTINYDNLIFSNVNIAGSGFINFILADNFLIENIEFYLQKNIFPWDNPNKEEKKKVIIDFSSPNIAKEMHVGHLRSTIVGDCIAKMLEFRGFEVTRINHLGDWGTQFGMLIFYLKFSNKLNEDFDLENLVDYYKEAKILFDNDLNFKRQAQEEVVKLQQGNKDSLFIWQKICNVSQKAFRSIYEILDIKIIDRGESFYNSMLNQVVKDFENQGLSEESDGAKCVYLEGFKGKDDNLLPLIIQKSDGGYNYATTDLAAIKYRVKEENVDWLIYVTDNGQALHFAMIFAAAQKVGYLGYNNKKIKLDHVPLGLVLRSDGKKFKTREGNTEKLKDLINNAIVKARQILTEKNPGLESLKLNNLAKIIGINAIKYADLSNNRNSDYIFDYDKMLKFTGNTAAFLSYAYVRINSIKNKANIDLNYLILTQKFTINNSYERNLVVRICRFNDFLASAVVELLPNRLTDYLYLLAEEFHVFFHNCKVIGSEFQNERLLLCEAVGQVMRTCFNILGLQTIEEM